MNRVEVALRRIASELDSRQAEIVADADVLEILPAVSMPVATAGHLVALKLLARDDETRPQDAADLRARAMQLLARLWPWLDG